MLSSNANRRNKRKNNNETAEDKWKMGDLICSLADYGQTESSRNHTRECLMTVVTAMLSPDTPGFVLHHYMHKVATEIEIDLRNRETSQLGARHIDLKIAAELEAENYRRVAVYLDRRQEIIDAPDREDPVVAESQVFCDELYSVLCVYQAMLDSLTCNGSPDYKKMIEAAQALFFCTVHMSREFQALLFKEKHRWRMPQHGPMKQQKARALMAVLNQLTPLYTSHVLSSEQYVDKLRRYVFFGSLELDDLQIEEDEEEEDEEEVPEWQTQEYRENVEKIFHAETATRQKEINGN